MQFSNPSDPLAQYVDNFAQCRVLVLGDAILDEYLLGDCSRISPEAPVPVLRVHAHRQELGGAANTAANIDLAAVDHGMATLRKTRVIGQQQQIVRLDYEDIATPHPRVDSEILSHFDAVIGR